MHDYHFYEEQDMLLKVSQLLFGIRWERDKDMILKHFTNVTYCKVYLMDL